MFVVISDDDKFVLLEYFGLIVSSHIEKSKDNSNLIYNEFLRRTNSNNLKYDSIVKCDQLYTIPSNNILFKIGTVDADDFIRFIGAYEIYLNNEQKV